MTPKISIVIPSYNKVRFIGKTLKSIFNQEYPNLEVIIQDGGSTDGTLKVIKNYTIKYPNVIKFESKSDGGQLNAVNIGLTKATGNLLSFINADDEYYPNSFALLADSYLSNPKAYWFAGNGVVVNSDDLEIAKPVTLYKSILLTINRYPLLLTTNYLMQPSIFFTRKAYKQSLASQGPGKKYGPFTGTQDFIMEYDFWLKLGKIQMPVVINKLLTKFRIESTTKTKTLFSSLLREDEKIVKKYTSNLFILFVHKLNNLGRVLVERFV